MKIVFAFLISVISLIGKAQVVISGTAINYIDTVFYIKEVSSFQNLTRAWRDDRVKITIDKNGRFQSIIPETSINMWCVETDKGSQIFDLVDGKNLKLIADFSKPTPFIAVGKNAGNFNYTAFYIDNIYKYYTDEHFFEKVSNKNIDSVLTYRLHFAEFEMNLLKKYADAHKISKTYYKWLISKYSYEPYERTLVENISNKDSIDERTLQRIIEKGTNDEYAALNTTEYNDLIDFYILFRFKQKNNGQVSFDEYFNFATNTNLIKGGTRDVFLTRLMYLTRTVPDSQYSPKFEKYNRIVANKKMKQSVIDARADYVDSPILEKPNFARAKSIEGIFEKYKGKVIYVDFWASWCVPCREEMPNAEILKNKLKGKDIVFLYIGYKDKEKAWEKARNQLNIEGEHYLLTEKMVKEADEVFNITGIPHYVIIDKDGKIVSKSADRPNYVYQQLLNLAEK